MNYETFKTQAHAEARIAGMAGWDTGTEQLFIPDDRNADEQGSVWVIQCNGSMYLRNDDFVR